jgi:hypothetical protein
VMCALPSTCSLTLKQHEQPSLVEVGVPLRNDIFRFCPGADKSIEETRLFNLAPQTSL